MGSRVEHDSLGQVEIPEDALWGPQTQRALENFAISGLRFGRSFIHALAHVKRASALANVECGVLDHRIGEAIAHACDAVAAGDHDDQFPVDIFQTGSGTSTNMNANEVVAHLATRYLSEGESAGSGGDADAPAVHPNDHVNRSQSSNDVIPTAAHVAAVLELERTLIPALTQLRDALSTKSTAFDRIVKTGRTHLMDAVPIRLGQEFGGYAAQVSKGIDRARAAVDVLSELPLGGTAVGTGVNRPGNFPSVAIARLNETLGSSFVEAGNHFEASAARDGMVEASGHVKTVAVSLAKIADDIRWLSSGPRSGLGELRLPAIQPGSSIMPGKVNPVMAEALIMASAHVIAADVVVTLGGLGGHFELNTMMPLMTYGLLTSIEWLGRAARLFAERCVEGIEVDEACCERSIAGNLSLATTLAPVIGYDAAAKIAQQAHTSGRTVREVALELAGLPVDELDRLLDAMRMTEPDD